MTAPASELVYDALRARIATIIPTLRSSSRFRQGTEVVEQGQAPSRAFRQFDVDVLGGADDSSEGRGVQNVGLSDRTASFLVLVSYPAPGRAERNLEKVILSDAEHVLRAVGRPANWTTNPSAPVHRSVGRWIVNRDGLAVDGTLVLEITVDVQYRDTE